MPGLAGNRRWPVLVLAPVVGDVEAIGHVLTGGGFFVKACADVESFVASITDEAGAVVVTEEALARVGTIEQLGAALARQPDWSDLPVILLAGQGANEDSAWQLAREFEGVGNFMILERPLRRSTLLSAVSVAFRARARQHELRAHREQLEATVVRRTAELSESMRELHAKERLAALGTLAVGLGHDIANLVLPIRMRLGPLANECGTENAREDVEAIGTSLNYLTNLSAGLRLMALDPARESVSGNVDDLAAWWAQVHGIMRGVLPRHVVLEADLPTGIGADIAVHRLTQCVFNIVQNAGEALAGTKDGVVRVTAEQWKPRGGRGMVRLRVSDNGPGMNAEVLSRCFEPYFSTKGRAIITGMGLCMVRGLIESAGGTIEVQSTVGHGATFVLTLPAAGRRGDEACAGTGANAARIAALSVSEPRTRAIAATLLEGMELEVVRTNGTVPAESAVWVVQDPDREGVEEFLARAGGRRVVVLRSDMSGAGASVEGGVIDARPEVIVLPLSVSASGLREALLAAVRCVAPR